MMTPSDIAKPNSEEAHQKALIAYCNFAASFGWLAADSYANGVQQTLSAQEPAIPELKWLHHINNGVRSGSKKQRIIEGQKVAALGTKRGVADLFLPTRKCGHNGLYIEMKKPGNKSGQTKEQKEFEAFVKTQNFMYHVVDDWWQGVCLVKSYLENEL